MKKTIAIFLIVIFVVNLICVNVYADQDSDLPTEPMTFEGQEEGQTTVKNDHGKDVVLNINSSSTSKSTVFKVVVGALTVLPQTINQLLETFIESTTNDTMGKYTIYDTVTGHYNIFNIDFLNIPDKINNKSGLDEIIKYNVIKNYNILRNLSIALSLFVLIYIGIRMAIATIAEDKAKYKKMFVNWLVSLILVFVIHLIIIIISIVLKIGLDIVNNIAEALNISTFEADLYSLALNEYTKAKGFGIFTSVIIIWLLTWYQLKFFIYYLLRTVEINFLILISPLITVTYSIDKAGDNKAQAFEAFFKELILKSSIQIIHAILYLVFIASAGVIATYHPIIAILFLGLMSRAEKIVKKIFTVGDKGLEGVKIPFIEDK